MALTISREQRDALYELVVDHLTSIGDVWIEFQNRDLVTAKRQAREWVEELHLMTDLGWEETIDHDHVALTLPPEELVATLTRLHRRSTGALSAYASRPKDDEALAARDVAALEVLGELLGQLAAQTAGHAGACRDGSR
jgi:hypothetical protein